MTREHIFHPEAQLDFDEAVAFYNEQQPDLGNDFANEVERALDVIDEHPEAYPVEHGHTRKFVLPRFPFSVMYSIEEFGVLVTAVAHQSRRHRYWRGRV